jgi:two-component system, cell cycle response regulator DivK
MDTILLVEDNALSRDALTRRLERHGFRVVVAEDGEQALALAETTAPDLILMDLGLPRLDGWSATRRLKTAPRTERIPIIVLSAHATPDDRDLVLAAGADDLDSKPVRFDELVGKIDALLKRGCREGSG